LRIDSTRSFLLMACCPTIAGLILGFYRKGGGQIFNPP